MGRLTVLGCKCKVDGRCERQVWESDMSLFVEEVCFIPHQEEVCNAGSFSCLDRSGGCQIKQPISPIQQECLYL